MKNSLRIDFYVLLAIIFGSVPIILIGNLKPLTTALLFFVIPTIYMFWRKPKPLKEMAASSLVIGAGLSFLFNIITSANNVWNELDSQLIFKYKIFGFLPTDEPIWFFFCGLVMITFYEHFYDKENKDRVSSRYKYLFFPTFIALLAVCVISIINKNLILYPKAYFITALPMVIPVIYIVRKSPELIVRLLKTTTFFFMLFLLYEIIAMYLSQWYFQGDYIGWVSLFGLTFPFEEMLFWMTLSPLAAISIYEIFIDNQK